MAEEEAPQELNCAVCMNLLCEPVKWPAETPGNCNHSYCRLCVYQVLRWNLCNPSPSVRPRCPICREPALDEMHHAPPEALVLDEELNQKVVDSCEAIEVQARIEANNAELLRMRSFEFEVPLHMVGSYALRRGDKIVLRLSREHMDMVVHALAHTKRRIGVVLSNYPYVGAPTRLATLNGFGFRDFTVQQARANLHWKMLQGRRGLLEIPITIGSNIHILAPPNEVEGRTWTNPVDGHVVSLDYWSAVVREEEEDAPPPALGARLAAARARAVGRLAAAVVRVLVPTAYRECQASLRQDAPVPQGPPPLRVEPPIEGAFAEA